MKYQNIFVAASSQHVGKTTSTLGLISCLIQKGINVGYCKPVGQKYLDYKNLYVDKDTLLFADLIKFDINPEHHSPVILPSNVVKQNIENPKNNFDENIISARNYLNTQHDLTIFEGTGHAGVGGVVGMSNARAAKLLNASVVLILEGGIGSTIDMYHMVSALFRLEEVPIIGVIINKVRQDKLEDVSHYLNTYFNRLGVPVLGLIPYDECLAYPLMSSVVQAIKGTVEYHDENLDNNRVENILAGSLVDLKELHTFQNHLIVSSIKTIDRAIKKVETFSKSQNHEESPISGIIITGEGDFSEQTLEYIGKYKIPVIRTKYDTLGTVIKISKIEVKINRHTPWKVSRAIELINENVDLDKIILPV